MIMKFSFADEKTEDSFRDEKITMVTDIEYPSSFESKQYAT